MDYNFIYIPFSACVAETVTYPIDYVKTRIQVNKNNVSFMNIFNNALKEKNVYNGLKPSLMRHCVYTLLRINIYEKFNKKDISITNKYLLAGFSGGFSQLIASPFDLLKVQYITKKNQQNIKINHMIKNIYKDNGFFGLWRGATPNISRAILVNFGELATYDTTKQYIKKQTNMPDGMFIYTCSSLISSYVSTVCCNPADVIKSRMMENKSTYKSIPDCIYKTYINEGIFAFYKGFFPLWFRMAPWQFTFWATYENLKKIDIK